MKTAALILVVAGCSSSPPPPPSAPAPEPRPAPKGEPGVAITFAPVDPERAAGSMATAADRARARLVSLGVEKPSVRVSGGQLVVELRGDDVDFADDVKRQLTHPGQLSFHWVDHGAEAMRRRYESIARQGTGGPVVARTDRWTGPDSAAVFEDVYFEAPTRNTLVAALGDVGTAERFVGYEPLSDDRGRRWRTYWLESAAILDNRALKSARGLTEGTPAIRLELTDDGKRRLAEATEKNPGRKLAIVIDRVVHWAPIIQERIEVGAIELSSSAESDSELDAIEDIGRALSSGPLPELKVVSETAL